MIENLPFSSLRVFECAARHLSFKQAAEELFITPAAVSQQIKTLEVQLGVKLFNRHGRGLSLTNAGVAGLPELSKGFDALTESVNRIRGTHENQPLTVWMAPSFAAKWLIPRLHGFYATYPGVDLNIAAGRNLVDSTASRKTQPAESFKRDNVDIAIHFGAGDYPGCRVEKLFAVQAIPLCSPDLLSSEYPLEKPEDLRFHTLLHDDTPYEGRPSWETWLEAAKVRDVDASHGIRFNHGSLALTAAVESQGVVLSIKALATDDIAAGRLVVPFDLALPLEYAYYLITFEESPIDSKIEAFREWLQREAAGEEH